MLQRISKPKATAQGARQPPQATHLRTPLRSLYHPDFEALQLRRGHYTWAPSCMPLSRGGGTKHSSLQRGTYLRGGVSGSEGQTFV